MNTDDALIRYLLTFLQKKNPKTYSEVFILRFSIIDSSKSFVYLNFRSVNVIYLFTALKMNIIVNRYYNMLG